MEVLSRGARRTALRLAAEGLGVGIGDSKLQGRCGFGPGEEGW